MASSPGPAARACRGAACRTALFLALAVCTAPPHALQYPPLNEPGSPLLEGPTNHGGVMDIAVQCAMPRFRSGR